MSLVIYAPICWIVGLGPTVFLGGVMFDFPIVTVRVILRSCGRKLVARLHRHSGDLDETDLLMPRGT